MGGSYLALALFVNRLPLPLTAY